eukprot:6169142-Prymnesium_polylepis.2
MSSISDLVRVRPDAPRLFDVERGLFVSRAPGGRHRRTRDDLTPNLDHLRPARGASSAVHELDHARWRGGRVHAHAVGGAVDSRALAVRATIGVRLACECAVHAGTDEVPNHALRRGRHAVGLVGRAPGAVQGAWGRA